MNKSSSKIEEINKKIEVLQNERRQLLHQEREATKKRRCALRYEVGNLFAKYFPDIDNIKFEGSKPKAESLAPFEKFLSMLV